MDINGLIFSLYSLKQYNCLVQESNLEHEVNKVIYAWLLWKYAQFC